jgi:hypothetical protein
MLTNDVLVPGRTYTYSGYINTEGLNPVVPESYGVVLMVTSYLRDGYWCETTFNCYSHVYEVLSGYVYP